MSKTEWKEYEMSELIEEISMGPFGSNIKVECFTDSGVPVLNGSNLVGFRLNEDSFNYVTEEKATSLGKANAYRGDIVITHRGTLGQIVYIPQNSKYSRYVISQSQFRVRCNEKVIPEYLVYYFHSRLGQHKLLSNASQVGVPSLARPTSTFQKLTISIPPVAKQKEIVKILSSLDDKIELNNAINRNLEEQAQALFKNWLIDFEPFGGKMPENWKEATLGEVCLKITDGSHFSPQDNPSAPYPMFSVKDMETYGFNPTNCKHISADDFEKMKAGDCVPKIDDVLVAKDGSYLKEIFICSEAREEAILSSIAIFRPNKSKILPEILLFLLKHPSVRKDVGDNFVSGSALPRIVLKDFKKYRFILPSMQIQQKLAKMLNSIRMEIHNNVDENQRLSVLRDSLLPRLMSGELSC